MIPHASAKMTRTCVYLPDDLRKRLRVAAAEQHTPIAQLIRVALESSVGAHRPQPAGGFLDEPNAGGEA